MVSDPITSWQIEGEKVETVTDFLFLGSKSLRTVTAAMKLRCLFLERTAVTDLASEKQRHCFANKGLYSQRYGFSSGYVLM